MIVSRDDPIFEPNIDVTSPSPAATTSSAFTRDVEPPVTDDGARLEQAVHGLARSRPELSAALPPWPWQRVALAGIAMAAAMVVSGRFAVLGVLVPVLLAIPFAFVIVLRAAALASLRTAQVGLPGVEPASAETASGDAEPLPRYTVLVPLVREAAVVPQLVAALRRLDYPADRLQILLVTEAFDAETREAIQRVGLPTHARVVVVPDGAPRTKPRALNYALQEASGDYVVVYDAEDCPEPGQLRLAVAAFRRGSADLGCLQARLNIYNPEESWLTRQFTLEYSALFDAILPLIERLDLPVPLGGTSNHFPMRVLRSAGGWDAFNVTEDADLGIRLARLGWKVGVLASTTWEEAPREWQGWLSQRSRWLKGWVQTYLVHMRQPRRLWRELGRRRFIGLQMLMSALLFSALLHPWFYVLLAWRAATGAPPPWDDPAGRVLWSIALFNLVAGYASAAALGFASLNRRRHRAGAWILWLPVYWMAISIAAYRGLVQLVTQPYHWEKTSHRGQAVDTDPAAARGGAGKQVSTTG